MKIYLKKFGKMLISRQTGKEAMLAFQPELKRLGGEEALEVDFEGVTTFSPSWGDEFLTPLLKEYGERLSLINTENPSVRATLKLLDTINTKPFQKK